MSEPDLPRLAHLTENNPAPSFLDDMDSGASIVCNVASVDLSVPIGADALSPNQPKAVRFAAGRS